MKKYTHIIKTGFALVLLNLVGCSSAPKYYITNTVPEPELPQTVVYQSVYPSPILCPPTVVVEPVW